MNTNTPKDKKESRVLGYKIGFMLFAVLFFGTLALRAFAFTGPSQLPPGGVGGPVPVTSGGTGAISASAARSSLGTAASGANSDITSLTGLTTDLPVSEGGTGLSTLTANNVIIGNGASSPTFVAPGTSGNVLTSNGTTWLSQALAIATPISIANGGTGSTTAAAARTALGTAASGSNSDITALNSTNAIYLPLTTASGIGIIYKGGTQFLHDYVDAANARVGFNTFVGVGAGNFNSTGAGGSNFLGSYNTMEGHVAFTSNTTGYSNTGQGESVFSSNTTGFQNTAQGMDAMVLNTSGTYNNAQGVSALYANTTGTMNTANGSHALNWNTTGNYNSALGTNALLNNSTGSYNVGLGVSTLGNTTSNYNTGVGSNVFYSNTSGSSNTALGFQAGYGDGGTVNNRTTIDTNLLLLGMYASRDGSISNATAMTNAIAIGYRATVACSNCMVLGGTGANAVNVGIGIVTPAAKLDVNGNSIIIRTSQTPATSTAACTTGTEAWDANFMYVCVATNTWKRASLVSF